MTNSLISLIKYNTTMKHPVRFFRAKKKLNILSLELSWFQKFNNFRYNKKIKNCKCELWRMNMNKFVRMS